MEKAARIDSEDDGIRLDRWTGWSFPLFIMLLPLLALVAILYQVVKDTSKRK